MIFILNEECSLCWWCDRHSQCTQTATVTSTMKMTIVITTTNIIIYTHLLIQCSRALRPSYSVYFSIRICSQREYPSLYGLLYALDLLLIIIGVTLSMKDFVYFDCYLNPIPMACHQNVLILLVLYEGRMFQNKLKLECRMSADICKTILCMRRPT